MLSLSLKTYSTSANIPLAAQTAVSDRFLTVLAVLFFAGYLISVIVLLAVRNPALLLVNLAYYSLIAFAICYLVPPFRRIAGLMERIFTAATLGWFFTIAFVFL